MAKKDYYKVLEVDKKASSDDIESAYKELVDIYDHRSASTYSLFDEDERERLLTEIKEAYEILSDELRRRQYDENVYILSNYKQPKEQQREQDKAQNQKEEKAIPDPRAEVRGFIASFKGVIDGGFMQKLREQAGMSLKDMCNISKLSLTVLEKLEGNEFTKLPGRAYTLGFAKLYFKIFTDEYEGLARQYIQNYDASLEAMQRDS